jgi:hypothetical protein
MIHLVLRYRRRVRLTIYPGRSLRQPAWSVLFLCILSMNCFGQASRATPAEKAQDAGVKNATEVEYQHLDIRPCLRQGEYVVDDENALQAIIELDRSSQAGYCKKFNDNPPTIDFSKHTLIGARVVTDFCQHFKVKIVRDDAGKRYRHIVIANKPPRCRGIGLESLWVVIPKLPPDYRVTFESQVEPGR